MPDFALYFDVMVPQSKHVIFNAVIVTVDGLLCKGDWKYRNVHTIEHKIKTQCCSLQPVYSSFPSKPLDQKSHVNRHTRELLIFSNFGVSHVNR